MMREQLTKYLCFLVFLFPAMVSGKTYTLKECIDRAVKNNFSVRRSRENVLMTQAQCQLSYSDMLPYISARSSITRNSSSFGPDPYTDTYSTNASFNQTVFDLSSIYNIKSSRTKVKESIASYEAAVKQTELAVSGAFYDFLKKEKLLDVKRLGLKESEQNLKKSKLMYDIGTLSKVELLRAEVVKNQSELDLLKARKDVELSRANLAYLIGLEPDVEFEVKEESLEVKGYNIEDYKKLFTEIKAKNPEVISEGLLVSRSKAELLSSYFNYFPTISLYGSYGYSGDKFTLSKEEWEKNDYWSVGASISLPLFTGFSRMANVKQSKASLRMKELELDDTITQKGIELKKALLAIDETQKTFNLAKKNLEQAELSYRMVKEKYNLGAATILELTDAEQDYEQALVSRISAYYDLLLSKLYITNLLGEEIVK